MKTDKESKAFRLMEALSAASQELLERSDEAGAATGGKKADIRFFAPKYAKVCAACLCLVVLGAAYFGASRVRMGAGGDNGNSGGANNGYDGFCQMEEVIQESASSDFEPSALHEPKWLDVESLQEIAGAGGDESGGAKAAEPDEGGWQEAARQEAENITEQSAVKENASSEAGKTDGQETSGEIGQVPGKVREEEELAAAAAVPAGYVLVKSEGGFCWEWSDGEHDLWLRLTQTELTADLRFEAEFPVYTVQEEWRELIPPADGNGYLQFGLLYENGMLAEYWGALGRDEIVSLLESLLEIRLPQP